MVQRLLAKVVRSRLAKFPHWRLGPDRRSIRREFQFLDFVQAFSFMTQVALLSERSNHHPDWQNVYNRVGISLTTHEAGGLTKRDFDLARAIDEAFDRFALVPQKLPTPR
jgi:4a-hydroxytetrahydrobiopterin dehydratase